MIWSIGVSKGFLAIYRDFNAGCEFEGHNEKGGEMKVLIVGIVALLLGLWGLIVWRVEFVDILQGAVPFLLLVGGLIATYAGIASAKDEAVRKKEEEIRKIEKIEEESKKEKEKKEELEKEKKEDKEKKKVVRKRAVRKKAVKKEEK